MYLQKHRISADVQEIEIVIPQASATAGIDPRNILVDRKPDDNVVKVKTE